MTVERKGKEKRGNITKEKKKKEKEKTKCRALRVYHRASFLSFRCQYIPKATRFTSILANPHLIRAWKRAIERKSRDRNLVSPREKEKERSLLDESVKNRMNETNGNLWDQREEEARALFGSARVTSEICIESIEILSYYRSISMFHDGWNVTSASFSRKIETRSAVTLFREFTHRERKFESWKGMNVMVILVTLYETPRIHSFRGYTTRNACRNASCPL